MVKKTKLLLPWNDHIVPAESVVYESRKKESKVTTVSGNISVTKRF